MPLDGWIHGRSKRLQEKKDAGKSKPPDSPEHLRQDNASPGEPGEARQGKTDARYGAEGELEARKGQPNPQSQPACPSVIVPCSRQVGR